MKKVLIIVVVFALSFGFLTLVNNMGTNTASAEEILTGTAEGFGGEVTVTVVVNGNDIVSVTAEGPDETEGVGSIAIDELPNIIAEKDSTDVDSITGATYTSDGIKEAVKNALATRGSSAGSSEETLTGTAEGFGGKITVTVVLKGNDIVSVKAEGPDETEGVGSVAIEELPGKIEEADSVDIEGVSGATYTSDGLKEAVTNAINSKN